MPPLSDQPRPVLEPPRFRLRTLLVVVAICCALLAFITTLDPYGMFAAIMLVLTVVAHVVGASLGHRLREAGSRPAAGENTAASERFRPVEPQQFAPATRLSHRRRPGRLILAMTITLAILGAIGGAALLVLLNGERATLVNVGFGAAAFSVLGAMGGFALAAFAQEVLAALFEAQKLK